MKPEWFEKIEKQVEKAACIEDDANLSRYIPALLSHITKLREALEPFAEYAKAIPDNWHDEQPLTIALNMPAHLSNQGNGTRILDIAVGAGAFRNADKALLHDPVKGVE